MSKDKLNITPIAGSKSYVVKFNEKYIGNFIMDVDGSFYFVSMNNNAWYSEYSLKVIYETLKELNEKEGINP